MCETEFRIPTFRSFVLTRFRDMEASPEEPVRAPVLSTVSTPSTVTARSQAKLGGFFSLIVKTDLLSRSEDALNASKEAHREAVATGVATLTTPSAGSTQ